jgi:hypothetical protein
MSIKRANIQNESDRLAALEDQVNSIAADVANNVARLNGLSNAIKAHRLDLNVIGEIAKDNRDRVEAIEADLQWQYEAAYDARIHEAHPFTFCEFHGPAPNMTGDWNEWAKTRPLKGVRVSSISHKPSPPAMSPALAELVRVARNFITDSSTTVEDMQDALHLIDAEPSP